MSTSIIERYQQEQQRINEACHQCGRSPDSVKLLAVSKTKPLQDIQQLADYGQKAFGENYVQEALEKIEQMPELEWHFIGPIQSNKTRHIAAQFNWVHSVDRLKIAQRLNDQRPEGSEPLNILLEVNISAETSKAGFKAEEVEAAAIKIVELPNLKLRGLMAIPQKADTFEQQCQPFAAMKKLLNELNINHPEWQLDTLSMGMSADLEAAIAEGATIVRIGTDIFGARNYAS